MIQLVVFDMDGVLVEIDSSWQVIHRAFAVDNEDNFRRHQQGLITYSEFMQSDIRLWGRTHQNQIQQILATVPLMPGAKTTLAQLRRAGKATAIISSGLMLLANRLCSALDIDYVYANQLITDTEGYLTGEGDGKVTLDNKGQILAQLCADTKILPENCAVIGDSRFDLSLFDCAGLRIAFNAQDSTLKQAADLTIEASDLRQLLPWILADSVTRSDLSFTYPSAHQAAIIVNALTPDNLHLPEGLFINSHLHEQEVKIRILSTKGLSTLLATLDDLLLNIQIIEKTFPIINPG
jgi:phosphoserine phosphatase